jgi:hypothetical protein
MNSSENCDENYLSNKNKENKMNIVKYDNTSIIKIIEEKNELIERYQKTIENQEKKFKVIVEKLLKNLNESSQEIISLKTKYEGIKNNNYIGLIEYYEKEIVNIINVYDKLLIQFKNKISILINKENNKQEKKKKVIEVLMKENEELKKNNEILQKINRKSEIYKLFLKSIEDNLENDNFDNFYKNKINQLDLLYNENEKLKKKLEEDKNIISDLTDKYNNLNQLYYDENNKIFKLKRIDNIKHLKSNSLNHSSSNPNFPKKNFYLLTNQLEYELDNNNIDKYLNSCKILISEKTNLIFTLLNKIHEKLNKENSMYKKIYFKNFTEISDLLNIIYTEINILIKKSNHAFNSSKISKQILNDILKEYNINIKNKDYNVLSNETLEYLKKYLNIL